MNRKAFYAMKIIKYLSVILGICERVKSFVTVNIQGNVNCWTLKGGQIS